MKILDVSSIENIPGYVEILKFVLKSQIQNLVGQLQDHAGEETLVLSANLTAGTLSHIESERGQGFLDIREDIKSQFLTHCLQGKQKYHTAEPPGQVGTAQLKPISAVLSETGLISPEAQLVTLSETAPLHLYKHKVTHQTRMSVNNTSTCLSMLPATGGFQHLECNGHSLSEVAGVNPCSKRNMTVTTCLTPSNTNKISEIESDPLTKSSFNNIITPVHKELREKNTTILATEPEQTPLLPSKDSTSLLHRQLASLPTINQSAIKDFISFSLNATSLPQSAQTFQQNLTPLKPVEINQSRLSNMKYGGSEPILQSSASCSANQSDSVFNQTLMASHEHISHYKSASTASLSAKVSTQNCDFQHSANSPHVAKQAFAGNLFPKLTVQNPHIAKQPIPCHLDDKQTHNVAKQAVLGQFDAKHVIPGQPVAKQAISDNHNHVIQQAISCSDHVVLLKQDVPIQENIKTTKRKQRRNTIDESPTKKHKIIEQVLTHVADKSEKADTCMSEQQKEIVSLNSDTLNTNISSVGVPDTSNISIFKMQPVVLIDENEKTSRKIFIETGTSNTTLIPGGCVTKNPVSLIFEPNVNMESVGSNLPKPGNITDAKEKDKTKKTLSSKIDEITQRITKDDAIKQHTVQTREDCTENSLVYGGILKSGVSVSSYNEYLETTDSERQEMTTPPNSEHLCDGDPSKLKDGSRASHRKPKLPRFNIGVASDDEDNAEVSDSPDSVIQDVSSEPGNGTSFGTPPNPISIGHDNTDIINIQVGTDDSQTSFPLNLEELADGLLLTDIPMVSYYNNTEDSSKSLIDSMLNVRPGRDPGTKKPLNAQSVIVSGSKQEKDWIICPLCPEKFQTIEGLQFHIKNVNHVEKKFECDLCKRKFSQLRDMERHRRIHTGERPFTCEVCNKSFSRKDNLKSHARKHKV